MENGSLLCNFQRHNWARLGHQFGGLGLVNANQRVTVHFEQLIASFESAILKDKTKIRRLVSVNISTLSYRLELTKSAAPPLTTDLM